MESRKKILIIDNAIDRKKKINALKQAGYAVFPALKLQEARSRCRAGAYDLIIVNAGGELQQASDFCDELAGRSPSQSTLLIVAGDARRPERHNVVPDDVDAILAKVAEILGTAASEGASSAETEHARATA